MGGEFDLPNGETLRQERTYEWSLDKQLIIGKTFRITDDSRRQTRKTIFSWNAEKRSLSSGILSTPAATGKV